jgi:hypothetical protein
MTKKKLFLVTIVAVVGLVSILSCAGLVVLVRVPPPDPEEEKYKASFDRIQNGMTRKEVGAIFGNDGIAINTLDPKTNKWREDRYWGPFNVAYDANNLVVEKFEVVNNDSAFRRLYGWYRHIFLS